MHAILALLLFTAVCPPATAQPAVNATLPPCGTPSEELVQNGGADEDISGWTVAFGGWSSAATYDHPPVAAHSGSGYFFEGTDPVGELYQDVPLPTAFVELVAAGVVSGSFIGWTNSWPQCHPDEDESRIIVEYRNATAVLSAFDTGDVRSAYNVWLNHTDRRPVPSNTTFVRIRLRSTETCGTENDGYYDDISLTLTFNCTGAGAQPPSHDQLLLLLLLLLLLSLPLLLLPLVCTAGWCAACACCGRGKAAPTAAATPKPLGAARAPHATPRARVADVFVVSNPLPASGADHAASAAAR